MTSRTFPSPVLRLMQWARRWPARLLSSSFERSPRRRPALRAAAPSDAGGECRAAMRSVLESQIIPRLLQVTRPGAATPPTAAVGAPTAADVEDFARVCAAGDRTACHALVARLRERGLQPDAVLVDLVAPAARHLGQRWQDDTLDFMSVTAGLVVMHELVHALGYEVHDGPQTGGAVRRVMLASAPGSQHVLGLSIVSEFFRKAGWQVVLEVSPSAAELCRAVGNEWFDLIGLSVALDEQLPALAALVGALRRASRNPQPPVLLGGPIFLAQALRAEQFGAQAICRDARESLALATALVER